MQKQKPKGGRGNKEVLRNEAIITLYRKDPEKFNFYSLGILFSRDPKTIADIINRELGV